MARVEEKTEAFEFIRNLLTLLLQHGLDPNVRFSQRSHHILLSLMDMVQVGHLLKVLVQFSCWTKLPRNIKQRDKGNDFIPFVTELAVSKGSQLCLFPHPNLASGPSNFMIKSPLFHCAMCDQCAICILIFIIIFAVWGQPKHGGWYWRFWPVSWPGVL